jgi:RNA polymerase sigma-54 factor
MTGFSQRLELRQSQKLIMTPRMQQAVKILTLSNLDLGDFVDSKIRENPLLERDDLGLEEHAVGVETRSPATAPEQLAGEFPPNASEQWQSERGEDGAYAINFREEPQLWHGRNGGFDAEARPGPDQSATRPMTLREHLLTQIGADMRD